MLCQGGGLVGSVVMEEGRKEGRKGRRVQAARKTYPDRDRKKHIANNLCAPSTHSRLAFECSGTSCVAAYVLCLGKTHGTRRQ